ncbi:hypothetical protein N7466_009277 [Penicillium verhagenii]|uniref:uncharacterized protein n=1 Tax=Penicillium verhagenii TaxID=1562060 RepID=UPI0025457372|nr:uncharacterized protein N7466_009277 [Penicillium verhagenii]KAJ5920951.1 hypothetical protein N7466_009277 [Penicillium verhagenii]
MGLTTFIQGGEYETASSEVMNSDIQTELSATLVAKHLVYQAVLGYGKVCDKRGRPSSPEQAKKLLLVFTNAILEDMVTRGVKVDDQEAAKSETDKMAEQVLKDSDEFQ